MKKVLLAVVAMVASVPAHPATITYTLSGFGGAQIVGGAGYNGAFTISGEADTSTDLNPTADITAYLFNNLTITFDGGVAHAIDPTLFFTNKAAQLGGILTVNGGLRSVIHFLSPTFISYDPATDMGPIDVTIVQSFAPLLRTDIGDLTWNYPLLGGKFTASTGQLAGVPETATWALMLFGFGLVGTALRRKTASVVHQA